MIVCAQYFRQQPSPPGFVQKKPARLLGKQGVPEIKRDRFDRQDSVFPPKYFDAEGLL
jgi:hypothetical protein